jgi:hypothetical protein
LKFEIKTLFLLLFLTNPRVVLSQESLSQTGLYSDIVSKIVHYQNRYFSPQYPLWTDGALKKRWILLPEGTKIDTSDINNWKFPNGTKLWKEFSFKQADGTIKRIETRLMEKLPDGKWKFSTYLWNEDETEAMLATEDGILNYYIINKEVTYDIPSKRACIFCHSQNESDPVLGFSALQISPFRDPDAIHGTPLTPEMTTLKTLQSSDLVTHPISTWPQIISSQENPLQKRIFGYFHGNCASCHNPRGSVRFLNLSLRHQVGIQFANEEPAYVTAVGVKTQDFQIPELSPGESFYVKPGDPAASAILFRMKANNLSHMPPVGTKIIDTVGVETLQEYIKKFLMSDL